jgi:hypothetical protein
MRTRAAITSRVMSPSSSPRLTYVGTENVTVTPSGPSAVIVIGPPSLPASNGRYFQPGHPGISTLPSPSYGEGPSLLVINQMVPNARRR